MQERAIHSFASSLFKNGWTTIYSGAKKVYVAILSPNRKPGFKTLPANLDELRERIANAFVALRRTSMARHGHERHENKSNKMRGT